MATPSNITRHVVTSLKPQQGTIEEPEDRTFFKISSYGIGTKEQEMIRLQQQSTDEREKRVLLTMQLRRMLKSGD
jgi:hypothetical protein